MKIVDLIKRDMVVPALQATDKRGILEELAQYMAGRHPRIDRTTLEGKAAGEVAVRCRQAGVACHAVVGQAAIDDFSFRVLALDGLFEAGDPGALRRAGRALA